MFPIMLSNVQLASDFGDLIKVLGAALAIIVVAFKLLALLFRFLSISARRRTLRDRLGAEVYDREEIKRATSFYVEPDFQSVDPSGGEDFRCIVAARESSFGTLDRVLSNPAQHRFVILLADSGMGKTFLLLNYYSYHWRSARRKRFRLALVPLNSRNADAAISGIPARKETVLFLDALDEDRRAIESHRERLTELMKLTEGFRAVLITCRSQFFPSDEEIPTETGVLRIGPVRPDESRGYTFHKLYLAPFTDEQVERYLKMRFPLHCIRQRRRARKMVRRIPDLVARPMLLAHVEDLVLGNRHITRSCEVYEEMINAWLQREKGLVRDPKALRAFSEELAVNIYENRTQRGMERIPSAELEPLARKYQIDLAGWQLRGRSLLNRDAVGNYKFAHRSVMEYLFVLRFLRAGASSALRPWTDLMKTLLVEMISASSEQPRVLADADLSSCYLFRMDLSRVILRSADLGSANLQFANLEHATLDGANLSRANLAGASLKRASLQKCTLRGARLSLSSVALRRLAPSGDVTIKEISEPILTYELSEDERISRAQMRHVRRPGPGHVAYKVRSASGDVEIILARDDQENRAEERLLIEYVARQGVEAEYLRGREIQPRLGADLTDSDMEGADIRGLNLTGVKGLTQQQVDKTIGDLQTILPRHLARPDHWSKRRQTPKRLPK